MLGAQRLQGEIESPPPRLRFRPRWRRHGLASLPGGAVTVLLHKFSLWNAPECTLKGAGNSWRVSHWRHLAAKLPAEVGGEAAGHGILGPVPWQVLDAEEAVGADVAGH